MDDSQSKESVRERVKKILSESSGFSIEQIVPDSDLRRDLGIDSLDETDVVLALEEEFNVKFSEADLRVQCVQQIVDIVWRHVGDHRSVEDRRDE